MNLVNALCNQICFFVGPMDSDSRSKSEEVVIPSVFIGQDDAQMIIENFLYDNG